jgi:aspergillopepsin I
MVSRRHPEAEEKRQRPELTCLVPLGDGSYASGSVWRDNLAMGGITVPNTYIESATSVSRSMVTDLTLSGLLGLAFAQPSEIEPAAPTLLDTLTPLLDAPLFTVDLHWHSNGVYEFGKIDSTKYTGEMMYTPLVNNSKYWELAFTGFNVGPSLYWLESEWKAIVDTGTTLMLLQDDLVELYYKNASSVGATYNATLDAYIFPCNATLPDLHIGFDNSYIASIPGKYLNYTDLQELSDFQNCYGGLQAVGSLPFSILGDVFLKSMYTVFDIGGARVGMADKVLNAKD